MSYNLNNCKKLKYMLQKLSIILKRLLIIK